MLENARVTCGREYKPSGLRKQLCNSLNFALVAVAKHRTIAYSAMVITLFHKSQWWEANVLTDLSETNPAL